ncbi:MAG: adenylosuccinate lyase [Candidatus Latescibacteria bacterium]|nr:adenylosuccinate lyase [Candidatus Latescibacterota bacterium]
MMSERPEISHVRPFTELETRLLRSWATGFDEREAQRVKEIEAIARHDVKAVEYYLKERLGGTSLEGMKESVHFCCTSEDINNLAYALMLKEGIGCGWVPLAQRLVDAVTALAKATYDTPLLTRTHGQPATPSTVGKELAVFVRRWQRQLKQLERAEYLGKFNGAVGSYNAHVIAYPDAPWEDIPHAFVERLGLTFNPLTTQIEPHDFMAELFHILIRFNHITLDFDRDMWSYISLGYFRQKAAPQEVGSSTMPHKINPIDFENSEANLGVSNALLDHLAAKLPISRLQRDLSDSSALRNIGVALGHAVVSLQSTLKGLSQVEVDDKALQKDLDHAWEVLSEAVQTVMRKSGYANPYEQMKALTRGRATTQEGMRSFIQGLDLPEADKQRLLALTPATYTGLAEKLVRHIL